MKKVFRYGDRVRVTLPGKRAFFGKVYSQYSQPGLMVVPATKSAVKYALATKSSGLGGPPQHLSHARRPAHQDPVRLPLRLATGHSEGPGQP